MISVFVEKAELPDKSAPYDVVIRQGDDMIMMPAYDQEAASKAAERIARALRKAGAEIILLEGAKL